MGYYVQITDGSPVLPKERLDEAYARLCELNDHDEWKRGGSYGGDFEPEKWFSWMQPNYPETCADVKAILEDVGYEVEYINGDLAIQNYDNKHGCEDLFIWYISDLFNPGSELVWRGEDGEMWKWQFGDGQKTVVLEPTIGWHNPSRYVPYEYGAL